MKRLTSSAIAAASLLVVSFCLLAALAWHVAVQPLDAARLVERHQSMSARLDGVMICMLQVEMAHDRYMSGGQPEDREGRDKALTTLGAALRAVDPAVLEETGHAPRFYLLQQHAMRRLPAWLNATVPAPAAARGVLRTGVRLAPVPAGQERQLAAHETQVLDALLAERRNRERSARAALALLAGAVAGTLCLLGAHAARTRAEAPPRWAINTRHAALEREAAIAAQERQRISRDMHDGIGQDLFALKLELERFHTRTVRDHPRLHEGVGRMLGLADDVMTNLRSVIDDLRPDGLEHGLEAAIRSQVDKFRRRSGKACSVHIRIDAQCDTAALNQETATALFRILQEALANIRRHANATHVSVHLAQRGDHLRMSVRDNGRGFDPAAGGKAGSFGLTGMRERIDACGGMLDIDSAPGRGTALAVTIPLRHSP